VPAQPPPPRGRPGSSRRSAAWGAATRPAPAHWLARRALPTGALVGRRRLSAGAEAAAEVPGSDGQEGEASGR
jgi:hypothetical protein